MRPVLTLAISTAVVAVAAWAPGVGNADAAPRDRDDHTRTLDQDRAIRSDRGPFFGLRVNSMDVRGEAITLACIEYRCSGLLPDEPLRRYQMVRHGYRDAPIRALDCDEILPAVFVGHTAHYRAQVITTRWMRMQGPSGSPIGGFLGVARIDAILEPDETLDRRVRIPFIDLGLIGTTGMRPGRSHDAADSDLVNDRCDTPFHDEGYYQGSFNRKGLRKIQRLVNDDCGDRIRVLRKLAGAVVAGTFEGRHVLRIDDPNSRDYCEIGESAWWFDGLLGHRCKVKRPETDVRVDPAPTEPVDRFEGVE